MKMIINTYFTNVKMEMDMYQCKQMLKHNRLLLERIWDKYKYLN